jgi:hypothetical protein
MPTNLTDIEKAKVFAAFLLSSKNKTTKLFNLKCIHVINY